MFLIVCFFFCPVLPQVKEMKWQKSSTSQFFYLCVQDVVVLFHNQMHLHRSCCKLMLLTVWWWQERWRGQRKSHPGKWDGFTGNGRVELPFHYGLPTRLCLGSNNIVWHLFWELGFHVSLESYTIQCNYPKTIPFLLNYCIIVYLFTGCLSPWMKESLSPL